MGVVVHLVDATIASDVSRFRRLSSRSARDVVVKIGAACNGVVQALQDVRTSTGPSSISALIVYGHGAPGVQGVSMGKDGAGPKHMAAITASTLDDPSVQAALASLKPRLEPRAVIVLRGCNTGEGEVGDRLIKKLARLTGVPVKASNWFQIVGRSELSGNIRTASPGGTVTDDHSGGLRNLADLPFLEGVVLVGAELWDLF